MGVEIFARFPKTAVAMSYLAIIVVLLVLKARVHGAEYKCTSIDYWGTQVIWDAYFGCRMENLTDVAASRCQQVRHIYSGSTTGVDIVQDINQPDTQNNWTMLMSASHQGHFKLAKKLLENGASTNIQDKCGWTALMFSAFTGYSTETVELLIQHGADVNLMNSDDRTALFMASIKGHAKIVTLLLKNGANRNHRDVWGESALSLGVYGQHSCHPGVVTAFLQHSNSETNQLMDNLNSALWKAVTFCCPIVTKDILCLQISISHVDFGELGSYASNRTSTPKCTNCSCLRVKSHLLAYKANEIDCTVKQTISK
jgi:hypothetical protein